MFVIIYNNNNVQRNVNFIAASYKLEEYEEP